MNLPANEAEGYGVSSVVVKARSGRGRSVVVKARSGRGHRNHPRRSSSAPEIVMCRIILQFGIGSLVFEK